MEGEGDEGDEEEDDEEDDDEDEEEDDDKEDDDKEDDEDDEEEEDEEDGTDGITTCSSSGSSNSAFARPHLSTIRTVTAAMLLSPPAKPTTGRSSPAGASAAQLRSSRPASAPRSCMADRLGLYTSVPSASDPCESQSIAPACCRRSSACRHQACVSVQLQQGLPTWVAAVSHDCTCRASTRHSPVSALLIRRRPPAPTAPSTTWPYGRHEICRLRARLISFHPPWSVFGSSRWNVRSRYSSA